MQMFSVEDEPLSSPQFICSCGSFWRVVVLQVWSQRCSQSGEVTLERWFTQKHQETQKAPQMNWYPNSQYANLMWFLNSWKDLVLVVHLENHLEWATFVYFFWGSSNANSVYYANINKENGNISFDFYYLLFIINSNHVQYCKGKRERKIWKGREKFLLRTHSSRPFTVSSSEKQMRISHVPCHAHFFT